MFTYWKEGASLEQKGQILRVLEESASVFEEAVLDNGEKKYASVTFQDWWDDAVADDTKKAWVQEDGRIVDPEYGVLDPETGEPLASV